MIYGRLFVRIQNDGCARTLHLKRFAAIGAITLAVLGPVVGKTQAQEANENEGQSQKQSQAKAYPFRLKHEVSKDDSVQTVTRNSPIGPGPAGAHLTYYGGPVVANIEVAVVYWGSGSYLPALTASSGLQSFYTAVTNGTYMDMLSEYSTQGVGGGGTVGNQLIQRNPLGYVNSFTITPSAANNGSTIDDSQIQAEIQAQISSGHLPTPNYDASGNANTLYMIYFPPGKTITQGGSSSCVSGGFCAYHGTFKNAANTSRNILYGVQPDMQSGSGCFTGCGNSSVFNNYTSVGSHEFAETITDAAVGLATVSGPPLAWYDNTNGEVGDICNAQQGAADGFTVQAEWSNLQNGCALGPVTFTVGTPASAAVGSSISVTVTAKKSDGTSLPAYRGTIHFTSTDATATLPADYTFTATDSGAHTFTGVILRSTGNQTITSMGTVNTGFKGTSPNIAVGGTVSNDFTISASPTSLTVAAGSGSASTIATAVTSGSAGTVSLTVSGAPSGVTASLSPTSVTAGSSSTLSVSTTTSAASGTYTLTVTGTEGTAVHSAAVSLTISGSGGGGALVNGGFESGLTGWTSAGSTSVASSGCHGGVSCAMVGSTSPTNGDSSVSQNFTAPSGSTGLSFWYKITCPDTVTYDWATATLKDNTAGTTATPLAKTCITAGAWTNVTASLTAGHSYTLTLTSHDDNYAGDPTFTLYDDVSITTTAPPPSGITNGGFESGNFTGWTTAGASETVVSSGCHSGTYCARAGSTAPTNGDSSITQSFTVPAGKTQLTLYYKMTCPDTVTYDWATVTLKNNTAGTTTTVLAKTCATSSTWINKTVGVTAGASYTLTLTSHDDNYSADPTFTLYDDVTLN